jgi:NAD kinase
VTYDKIVLVTRKTRLANLIDRFNTTGQARFYLEQAGLDFSDYAREHDTYERALDYLKRSLELRGMQLQTIDRSLLPTFRFDPGDLVVTLGGNGLVANTAKYVGTTPIIPLNPEP